MTNSVITFTTDFGQKDGYTGIVKGVMTTISQSVPIVDISHDIEAWDVGAGAFIIYNAYKQFPAGSIHLGVVDPGVGSDRKGILLRGKHHSFVGPDNGLCSYLLNDHHEQWQAYQLTNQNFWRRDVSSSFHARDIFGPVCAFLACGMRPEEFGKEMAVSDIVKLSHYEFVEAPPVMTGRVIYVDRFGNLITNIRLNPEATNVRFTINGTTLTLGTTYSSVARGKPNAFVGSHGFVEISVNCGRATEALSSTVGAKVVVSTKA
ncbi:MAG: SAM-dependent chlorinase/fluorinase [Candidatus Obscuribacterales bacterium]|jgi:hypothetical protein